MAISLVLGLTPPAYAQELDLGEPSWRSPVDFTSILSVRELEDGILVADAIEAVQFVGWESASPVPIGGIGRGPGEVGRVGPLFALAADSTVLLDQSTGRWLLLEGVRIAETVSEFEPINAALGTAIVGFDFLGHVVGERRVDVGGLTDPAAPDSVLLLLGHRARGDLEAITTVPGQGGSGPFHLAPRGAAPSWYIGHNPLASRAEVAVFADGVVAVVYPDPYRVDWRTADGRWTTGPELPFAEREVTREEQCAAIIRMVGDRPCAPDEIADWPSAVPPFVRRRGMAQEVFAAPDARVVIRRFPHPDATDTRYDVVGRSGGRPEALVLAAGERIAGFGRSSVYLIREDEYGLQSLRRYSWPPAG